MSNDKPKSLSIPQWQQPSSANSASSTTSQSSDDTSRSALLEQATKFLQDDSIRNAPTERKIAFLESKGLQNAEIESLLGVSRDAEATSKTTEDTTTTGQDPASTSLNDESQKPEPSASSSSSSSSSPLASPSSSSTATNTTKTTAPRDVAPIITYPEFLVQQSKPPPLVTLRSVLYTLYGAAGLGASIYGASEFLVKPMVASLTSARQELAETATDNLKKLNGKLEQNVSKIPPQLSAWDNQATSLNETSDEDSDSDPTELFHRDVATQTSQNLPLPSSSPDKAADDATPDPTATVTTHQKRLETITSNLREFADLEKESGSLDESMRTSINDLHHYLDLLMYSRNSYNPVSGYGLYSPPGMDSTNGSSVGLGKGEEDAISGFRAEIRSVKGALLSARNFPLSRGRVGSGASMTR